MLQIILLFLQFLYSFSLQFLVPYSASWLTKCETKNIIPMIDMILSIKSLQ